MQELENDTPGYPKVGKRAGVEIVFNSAAVCKKPNGTAIATSSE